MNKLLQIRDYLPLTCSRKGTCCHGNQVFLNPWELRRLATEKQLDVRDFSAQFCDWKGIRLKFDGLPDHRNKKACNLYIPDAGCSIHEARPLACRLFPLGRQVQAGEVTYVYQGNQFPCLDGCSEVNQLPFLTVEAYLKGQQVATFEQAQDAYLEMMQNLADVACMLFFDTGLAQSGDTQTRVAWRKMGEESVPQLSERIGEHWFETLIYPSIPWNPANPKAFIEQHEAYFFEKMQVRIDQLTTFTEIRDFSIVTMAFALLIGKSIGADVKALAEMWSELEN